MRTYTASSRRVRYEITMPDAGGDVSAALLSSDNPSELGEFTIQPASNIPAVLSTD